MKARKIGFLLTRISLKYRICARKYLMYLRKLLLSPLIYSVLLQFVVINRYDELVNLQNKKNFN